VSHQGIHPTGCSSVWQNIIKWIPRVTCAIGRSLIRIQCAMASASFTLAKRLSHNALARRDWKMADSDNTSNTTAPRILCIPKYRREWTRQFYCDLEVSHLRYLGRAVRPQRSKCLSILQAFLNFYSSGGVIVRLGEVTWGYASSTGFSVSCYGPSMESEGLPKAEICE